MTRLKDLPSSWFSDSDSLASRISLHLSPHPPTSPYFTHHLILFSLLISSPSKSFSINPILHLLSIPLFFFFFFSTLSLPLALSATPSRKGRLLKVKLNLIPALFLSSSPPLGPSWLSPLTSEPNPWERRSF